MHCYLTDMATYQRMLKEFERQGLAENSQVTYHEVKAALDSITLANTAVHEFDPEVATEIWNETEENNAGNPIMLRDYVATMVRAENILRGQVETTQGKLLIIQPILIEKEMKRKGNNFSTICSPSQKIIAYLQLLSVSSN